MQALRDDGRERHPTNSYGGLRGEFNGGHGVHDNSSSTTISLVAHRLVVACSCWCAYPQAGHNSVTMNSDIAFAGATEQARLLADGAITSPALVDTYLDRIKRLNPLLRAYRVVFDDSVRAEALVAQRRLDAGERLPLLGVPIAIKDDVDVAGEVTTMGTCAHGPAKEHDAEVVRKLREAGAVILGKTSVPELCIWPFTESLTFGATRNPWDVERTPGGSSGGSAAAVAAGLAAIALGSDGAGSIRIPSTWCGLFGIKPQRDRVPLAPHDDAWNGLSVNGPICRTVADAALFLDVTSSMPGPLGRLRRSRGASAGAAANRVEHQGPSAASHRRRLAAEAGRA